MNAGYWRLRGIPARGDDLAALAAAAAAGGAVGGLVVAAAAAGHEEEEEQAPVHVRYPRTFGYVYRP